jgi:hypothetical protein
VATTRALSRCQLQLEGGPSNQVSRSLFLLLVSFLCLTVFIHR